MTPATAWRALWASCVVLSACAPRRGALRLRGVEVSLRGGYQTFARSGGDAFVPDPPGSAHTPGQGFRGGPSLDLDVGLRLGPRWALGLGVGHGWLWPAAPSPSLASREVAVWRLGVFARLHLRPVWTAASVDPWISAGVDPLARFVESSASDRLRVDAVVHAVSVPVTAGLDVRVSGGLALGLYVGVAAWLSIAGCAEAHTDVGTSAQCGGGLAHNGWLFGGATARYLFR
ncbi:MAG: hypothetical protein HY909_22440 [Deltaproteobacteria bacterium]|nr:hypothetical protein [Deltaproteobacteria bacterium]